LLLAIWAEKPSKDFIPINKAVRKFCLKLIFGLIIVFALTNSAHVYSCPECGCWEQWVRLQKRTYLDKFASLPKKEKIITIGNYQVFLTSIQILPDTFELLIYAQNPRTRKPYLKNKEIAIYKEGIAPDNDLVYTVYMPPALEIQDNDVVSTIRYINPLPANYTVKIGLEDENTSAINSCTVSLILGVLPPNYTYIIIIGAATILVFIGVLVLGKKKA
jgi:hypothetical protein